MARNSIISAAVVTLALAVPATAQAVVYDLHLGGMCSTNFNDGKGGSGIGAWANETSINLAIDQRGSLSTAANALKSSLDTYCLGANTCYIYNYSAGDMLLGYVFGNHATNWNIGYITTAAGAGGGSNMADDVASTLACAYANNVQESNARNSYNHNDTNGEIVYRLGGYKGLFESSVACAAGSVLSVITLGWVNNHCLTGDQDGAVEYHSAGAYSAVGDYTDLWHTGYTHWTNHHSWWTVGSYDEGDNLNHYEMKRFGVCIEGGIAGQSSSTCTAWADSQH